MAQKKFILAHMPYIFDNMADLSAQLVVLAEEGRILDEYVIGSYLGTPEINTSISVSIGGKSKRINKSNIKLATKQVVSSSPAPRAVNLPESEPAVVEEAPSDENDGICSFCAKKWVRKTVLEGFNTFLCEYHLKLETQLASITAED